MCRQIAEGPCEEEKQLADKREWKRCTVCGNKGFIDLGNGTGVCCDSCSRGYLTKLWIKHKGEENSPIKVA